MRAILEHSFLPCAGPEDFNVPAYFEHTLDLLLNGLRTDRTPQASGEH